MTTYRTLRDALNQAGEVITEATADIEQADQVLAVVERRIEERRASLAFTCPDCGGERSRVIESRGNVNAGAVRRRRECVSCETRWTTVERMIRGTVLKKSA